MLKDLSSMEELDVSKEILVWQRLQGLNLLKELLPKILDSSDKRRVYELSNGSKTVRDIEKEVGVSKGTISKWWNNWNSFGIVRKEGRSYIKIVALDDLEIPVQVQK